MVFAGSSRDCALLELRALGVDKPKVEERVRLLCYLVSARLAIPKERTYVLVTDVPRGYWGWNGGVFAQGLLGPSWWRAPPRLLPQSESERLPRRLRRRPCRLRSFRYWLIRRWFW